MLEPMPSRSPPRGTVKVRAVLFDTFGTVCDFYAPFSRAFSALAQARGVDCDAGRLAIEWRTAYVIATATQAMQESEFVPLRDINRANLEQLLAQHFPVEVSAAELETLVDTWEKLEPWPDTIAGLRAIRELAIIAPLSNGNFADMVRLARNAGLPWDIVLGASVSGFYKPHPKTYTGSVAALALDPAQVCMVAAHQVDLAFAAGHGMQTAFVPRPDEFGGATKPRDPEPGASYIDAAEIYPEGDWTYVAEDFLDLAAQLRKDCG
ncbi:MAG: haloacid dehalogenase type II [Halioglobus sp.]|nr:haloacid dehalogenase type II [Halioglobus sp.]